MGKLDLIKGQPAYLGEKSKKRKKPHESDQGENASRHLEKAKKPRKPKNPPETAPRWRNTPTQWQALNYQTFANPLTSTIPMAPAPSYAVHATTMPSSSKEPEPSLPVDPLRSAYRASVSAWSAFPSIVNNTCLLCGGLKHNLRDCPVPKGGIEK